jgi:hypothetical protein
MITIGFTLTKQRIGEGIEEKPKERIQIQSKGK